jgi:hypothetical protein
MRLIKVLLITMLVWAPVAAHSVAHAGSEGRAVAAAKAKKAKKVKAKKTKKAKKAVAAKAKGKKAKKATGKVKAKKGKKAVAAKKPKSHAPAEHLPSLDDDAGDPAGNFEISPEMQDELPAPNNGDLTD